MYVCKIVHFVGAGSVCKSLHNTRNVQYESSSQWSQSSETPKFRSHAHAL